MACSRRVSSSGASVSVSISAHMMSLASITGVPSTTARPDSTATSSFIDSTSPSSSITSPGRTSARNSTEPIESNAARLRVSVVSITSQVPAWQKDSRTSGGGMTRSSPSPTQNSSPSEQTLRARTDLAGSHSRTRSTRWNRIGRGLSRFLGGRAASHHVGQVLDREVHDHFLGRELVRVLVRVDLRHDRAQVLEALAGHVAASAELLVRDAALDLVAEV